MTKSKEELRRDSSDNLQLYNEYNKTLRAWLVGFGFGVPALFIVNESAWELLAKSPSKAWIVIPFVIGAVTQVLIAFLNKVIAWCAHHRDDLASNDKKCWCITSLIAQMESWFILDILADMVTLVAFGLSLVNLLRLYGI